MLRTLDLNARKSKSATLGLGPCKESPTVAQSLVVKLMEKEIELTRRTKGRQLAIIDGPSY